VGGCCKLPRFSVTPRVLRFAGTIHIFSLDDGGEAAASAAPGAVANTTSKMGLLKGLLPKYFSSEWSFAQWKCDSPEALVAFAPVGQNSIYVLSNTCSFSKLSFDAASGDSLANSELHSALLATMCGA